MEPVKRGAIFPNRRLREAGLFAHREIRGMAYTDFFTSRAFAVADHQARTSIAATPPRSRRRATALADLPGVAEVLDRAGAGRPRARPREQRRSRARGGAGAWFAYPWFDKKEAPDYASHVDIHNKPGYDPCELFFGWPPGSVCLDTTKIRGSHGNAGPGYEIAWTTSLELEERPQSLLDLAQATRQWMTSCV